MATVKDFKYLRCICGALFQPSLHWQHRAAGFCSERCMAASTIQNTEKIDSRYFIHEFYKNIEDVEVRVYFPEDNAKSHEHLVTILDDGYLQSIFLMGEVEFKETIQIAKKLMNEINDKEVEEKKWLRYDQSAISIICSNPYSADLKTVAFKIKSDNPSLFINSQGSATHALIAMTLSKKAGLALFEALSAFDEDTFSLAFSADAHSSGWLSEASLSNDLIGIEGQKQLAAIKNISVSVAFNKATSEAEEAHTGR